ncbi:hypothetical protein EMIT051CA3_50469 [Pseudomonas chlororaphis]
MIAGKPRSYRSGAFFWGSVLAELRGQFAQQHFGFQDFADHVFGFVAGQTEAFEQGVRDVFDGAGADAAAAQQAYGQAHQVRVFGVGAVIARVVLEAQGGGQLVRHIPVAHQPGADLLAADAQQVLFDIAVAQVRVDLQVTADQREVRREDVGQQQVAEVVQQAGEVGQAGFRALGARHGAGQAFDDGGGVDRLLPVRRAVLRVVLGQAQGLAQGQAQRQVDHQVEAQHADDGVFHRADLARRSVIGRSRPAHHLRGQGRVGFHHAGDVVDGGVGVDPQLDDLLRGFGERRNLDGRFQALLDAPGGEGLHRLGDFLAVVVRAVEVRADAAQGFAEVAGAGLAQHALEGVAGDFQQQARFAGVDQQVRLAQQAFFVQAGRAGERRQAGQQAQVVFAEHALQAFRGDSGQAAAGQFGEAIEVQQLALREQHHQRADGVVQQDGLYLARGWQARVVEDFREADVQFAEQQPDYRRSVRGCGGEGNFCHGLYPFSNNFRSITSLIGAFAP